MLNILVRSDEFVMKRFGDVEAWFSILVKYGETFDGDDFRDIMEKIDSVSCKEGIEIKTEFGTATLNELSTGCKTVLLAVLGAKEEIYVPIDGCGENALKVLFQYAEKTDIYVTTRYPIILFDENIECMINDEKCIGGQTIFLKLSELLNEE